VGFYLIFCADIADLLLQHYFGGNKLPQALGKLSRQFGLKLLEKWVLQNLGAGRPVYGIEV